MHYMEVSTDSGDLFFIKEESHAVTNKKGLAKWAKEYNGFGFVQDKAVQVRTMRSADSNGTALCSWTR